MHPHTIDWLRNVEITADSALAQKRWGMAEKYGADLTRQQIINLVRFFLFPKPDAVAVTDFTNELLKLDPEFPVSGNAELLRVMAGLVMATTFETSSPKAGAFALGLRAAQLAGTRGSPVVAGIAAEAESYLVREAAAQRPNNFETNQKSYIAKLVKKSAALTEAQDGGDATKVQEATSAYHAAIADQAVAKRVRQLAEESQLLWLVVGEYSPSLGKPTAELSASAYAFVVAAEASARIQILPAPPAMEALFLRALTRCKPSRKKNSIPELLVATDAGWRAERVAQTKNGDCRMLLPMCAALEKMQELGDAAQVALALPKLCPGVKANLSLWPVEAARQYFSELSFLAALENC